MLDHAFLVAVDSLRRSCREAMLDLEAGDERFQTDLLGGDLTWETTCALPGEGKPPRVRADVTLDWPTWSQTAYRTWHLEGELDEPPELGLEVVLRLQDLADEPDLGGGARRPRAGRSRARRRPAAPDDARPWSGPSTTSCRAEGGRSSSPTTARSSSPRRCWPTWTSWPRRWPRSARGWRRPWSASATCTWPSSRPESSGR